MLCSKNALGHIKVVIISHKRHGVEMRVEVSNKNIIIWNVSRSIHLTSF